jgi:hypothetical protein
VHGSRPGTLSMQTVEASVLVQPLELTVRFAVAV